MMSADERFRAGDKCAQPPAASRPSNANGGIGLNRHRKNDIAYAMKPTGASMLRIAGTQSPACLRITQNMLLLYMSGVI